MKTGTSFPPGSAQFTNEIPQISTDTEMQHRVWSFRSNLRSKGHAWGDPWLMKAHHPKQRPTKAGWAGLLNPAPGPSRSISRMQSVSAVRWVAPTVFPVLVFPLRGFSLWGQRVPWGPEYNVNTLKSWLWSGCLDITSVEVWKHSNERLLSHTLYAPWLQMKVDIS